MKPIDAFKNKAERTEKQVSAELKKQVEALVKLAHQEAELCNKAEGTGKYQPSDFAPRYAKKNSSGKWAPDEEAIRDKTLKNLSLQFGLEVTQIASSTGQSVAVQNFTNQYTEILKNFKLSIK